MSAYAHRRSRRLGHERLTVKRFADKTAVHKWLNGRSDNDWTPYDGPLSPGTYAFCGGEWRNVKTLPPELLAHV
ncbi:MAG: hypothetical protein ABIP48_18055 [Planctomycetota bacterium]